MDIHPSTTYVFGKSGNLVRAIEPSEPYRGQSTWVVERVAGATAGKRMVVPARSLSIAEACGNEWSLLGVADWFKEEDRRPARGDGPMANQNKVQVEVLTPSGAMERRNYYVANETGGFDDFDVRPVKAWRPIPVDSLVEVRRWRGPTIGWQATNQAPWIATA
ncbi:hypothetical protein [Burkholderia gladioli]|uniref:hypothetical protein n=1 Tax=Burkholderia gladioli TaxID=28095 RepID=UPI001641B92A|nr:hypothetical protein [Burkholderia gladioli]